MTAETCDPNLAFIRAIEICGGQAKAARALTEITGTEITQQRIWNILHRRQKVPAELVLPIEKATAAAGQIAITRHQLRPDLYPMDEEPTAGAIRDGAAASAGP